MITPPHSLEAEQAVIGSVFLDSSIVPILMAKISDQDFYFNQHKPIIRAIFAQYKSDPNHVDIITVEEQIKAANPADDYQGLFAYLADLNKNTPSSANVKAYLQIVIDYADRRRTIEASQAVIQASADGDMEALLAAKERLEKIGHQRRFSPIFDFHDALNKSMLMMTEKAPDMDSVFHECLPLGEPAILTASGGVGKSFTTIQIGIGIACGRKIFGGDMPFLTPSKKGKVVLIGGEDSDNDYWRRIQGIMKDINLSDKEIADVQSNFLVKSLVGEDIRIIKEEGGSTLYTDFVDRFCEALSPFTDNLRLIIFDPMIRFYGANENDNHTATMFINAINKICQRTGAAVLLVHHSAKHQVGGARGASAFIDGARTHLSMMTLAQKKAGDKKETISHDDKDKVILEMRKSNHFKYWGRDVFLGRCDHGTLQTIKPEFNVEQSAKRISDREKMNSLLDFVKTNGGKTTMNSVEACRANIDWGGRAPSKDEVRTYINNLIESNMLNSTDGELMLPDYKDGDGVF